MHLQTKPDYDKTLQRFEAWWAGEIIDRPPVHICVRRRRPPTRQVPPKSYASERDRWMDFEHLLDSFEAGLDGAEFFADTFPAWMPNLGPDQLATVFGCELKFGQNTSWSVPCCDDVREVVHLQPDYDNAYWAALRDAMGMSLDRGQGRWITALPDLHTNGDLLAALRDPEALCLDYVDDFEGVQAALDHLDAFTPALYDDLWKPLAAAGQPATTWLRVLHAGRMYVTSCDFICMISEPMFRQTILKSLVKEMRFLERNIYHLDGPDALRHLDALLEQDELDAVQWVYGAGNGPGARWIEVYQKIQAAGKSLELIAENADDAFVVMEHIRPEGVLLSLGGAYDRDEAENILKRIETWSAGKGV